MADYKYEKELKQYFKAIKSLFPVFGQNEKRFISDLKADIEEEISSSNPTDFAQIVSHFGEPKTIVANYFLNAETDFSKRIKTIKLVRIVSISIIAIALFCTIVFIVYISKEYQQSKEAQATDSVTHITVIEE